MTITQKIKSDYGSLKHFAKKEGLAYQSLRNTISGQKPTIKVLKKLIGLGYIQTADELKKEA